MCLMLLSSIEKKESEKRHNHRQIKHYWEELPCQTEWITSKESKNKIVQEKRI